MADLPYKNVEQQLNSAEVASIFANYMNMSLSERVFEQFSVHVEIPEVVDLVKNALSFVRSFLSDSVKIMSEASLSIPIGFTANDVNLKAPRLFVDEYYVHNIMNFSRLAMADFATAIGGAARSDLYELFSESLTATNKLHKQSVELALNKGMYVPAPIVPYPYKRDYVEDDKFISSGTFGRQKRPLLATEISYLHMNIIHNTIGSMMNTAFSQVAKDDEVRQFLVKGIRLAEKQIEAYGKLLQEFQVPVPSFPNSLVTDSNLIPPYSDKLMLYEANGMASVGLTALGQSLTQSMRMDIQAKYTKFAAEIASYSKEGLELTIKKGWMEQPPETADRQALAQEPRKGE
ncbi:DUF3231 family protein [Aciduricibacillus chroicocephali]|uniref:DUF3231 family protein n=1 Tax=Aciduricibacillus chroicocephali TaxID=3054939 RepID=A0ABY9KWW8_9BACI|nr:DUF3231 family protein [Bacillaceae bacterium 44XB]